MKQQQSKEATWEVEGAKEAPRSYIRVLLEIIFPESTITDVTEEHITGIDWRILLANGHEIHVDDKNDLYLGLTGNISLDEATIKKQDTIQLFVNFPRFQGNYLTVFNRLLSHDMVKEKAYKKVGRKQPWGGTTYTYIIQVAKILHAVPDDPRYAYPSKDWFKWKRK